MLVGIGVYRLLVGIGRSLTNNDGLRLVEVGVYT